MPMLIHTGPQRRKSLCDFPLCLLVEDSAPKPLWHNLRCEYAEQKSLPCAFQPLSFPGLLYACALLIRFLKGCHKPPCPFFLPAFPFLRQVHKPLHGFNQLPFCHFLFDTSVHGLSAARSFVICANLKSLLCDFCV